MNPYLIACGLIFLVPGLIGLARPRTMLAFENRVQARLWKRPPLPNHEARIRKNSLFETILGALMLAFSLF
ncbi:MAG: hypothetical protein EON55_10945 [Alphaproteobacteria bacterium]|nr:MAG: hypothetical protein EON55_10945 [Alphaproteobacteria bacterium]